MPYAGCITQLVTRVDNRLVADVDQLVADGVVASRSDAVRVGLRRLVDEQRRRQVAAAIVGGYREHPQSHADIGWSDDATAGMIAEEPW